MGGSSEGSACSVVGKLLEGIERSFAWFNKFRRLIIRYERRLDMHYAFTSLACSITGSSGPWSMGLAERLMALSHAGRCPPLLPT
jgi:hypothetical protein